MEIFGQPGGHIRRGKWLFHEHEGEVFSGIPELEMLVEYSGELCKGQRTKWRGVEFCQEDDTC